ncbi:MAG: hypothetical protein D3921_15645, partial [Candidatus Electrothrix sp. AW1]|nr:hypothetical protein [Candidatus Electrothrix gigas]
MRRRNMILCTAAALLLSLLTGVPIQAAHAENLQILSGGGYKKPMQAVIAAYRKQSGKQVVAGYGNMRQILSQAKASGKTALVIGDEKKSNRVIKENKRLLQEKAALEKEIDLLLHDKDYLEKVAREK